MPRHPAPVPPTPINEGGARPRRGRPRVRERTLLAVGGPARHLARRRHFTADADMGRWTTSPLAGGTFRQARDRGTREAGYRGALTPGVRGCQTSPDARCRHARRLPAVPRGPACASKCGRQAIVGRPRRHWCRDRPTWVPCRAGPEENRPRGPQPGAPSCLGRHRQQARPAGRHIELRAAGRRHRPGGRSRIMGQRPTSTTRFRGASGQETASTL